MYFDNLIGKKVSILLEGKDNKIEDYSGILEEVHDDYVKLNPNNPNYTIEYLMISKDIIKSVWVYKE